MFNDIILESEGNVIIALMDCMYKESMMIRNGFDAELFMEADTASNGKKWYQKLWDGITAAWNWIKKSFEQLKNKIFKKDNGKIPEDKFKALMEEYKTGKYPRISLKEDGSNGYYLRMHGDVIFAMTYINRAIILFNNIIKQCVDQLNANKPLTIAPEDMGKLNAHMSEFDKKMINMKNSKSSNMEPYRRDNLRLMEESKQAVENINANISKIKTTLGDNVSTDATTQELFKMSKRIMKSFGNVNAYMIKAEELASKQYKELQENAWNPKSDKESTDQKADKDPKQLETKETEKDEKSQDQTTQQPEQQTSPEQPATQPDSQQQNTQQPEPEPTPQPESAAQQEPTPQQQSPQSTQQPQRPLFDFGPIKNAIASAKKSRNFIDSHGRQTSDPAQAPFAFTPVKNNTIFQIYPNLEYFTNLENGTESGKRLQQLRLYFNLIDSTGNPIDFTSNKPHVVAQFKPATRLPAGSRLDKRAYNKNGIIVFK